MAAGEVDREVGGEQRGEQLVCRRPVACVGVDNAKNAAVLAARILSV